MTKGEMGAVLARHGWLKEGQTQPVMWHVLSLVEAFFRDGLDIISANTIIMAMIGTGTKTTAEVIEMIREAALSLRDEENAERVNERALQLIALASDCRAYWSWPDDGTVPATYDSPWGPVASAAQEGAPSRPTPRNDPDALAQALRRAGEALLDAAKLLS